MGRFQLLRGIELGSLSRIGCPESLQSNDVKVPYPGIEAELRAIMAELRKASIEGDVDAIANSISDDYIQTDINGYRQDKKTWLNEYFRPLPT
jgi:hypothetical protein